MKTFEANMTLLKVSHSVHVAKAMVMTLRIRPVKPNAHFPHGSELCLTEIPSSRQDNPSAAEIIFEEPVALQSQAVS